MTSEERQSIIDELTAHINTKIESETERAYLGLPVLVGSLMEDNAKQIELNQQFYKDHSEFKKHKVAVASTLEELSGRNPTKKLEELMNDKDTIATIRERIKTEKRLDTTTVSESPSRSFTADRPSDHGKL